MHLALCYIWGMGTPSTCRFKIEVLFPGEKSWSRPTWNETQEEVDNVIRINSKRYCWRITDQFKIPHEVRIVLAKGRKNVPA